SRDLALHSALHSAFDRVSVVTHGRCSGPDQLLAHPEGSDFPVAMVRYRAGDYRTGNRGQAGRGIGGAFMTSLSLFLILVWLAAFVSGQLLFKRAMESSRAAGFRNRRTITTLGIGIVVMTISFLLNLGLLQRFDLSYVYPFQGSSIIIITLLAA